VAHAWMPEARRIRAETDGGPLAGGAPRAVWLTLGTMPGAVSVQSAAQRLISERRPCHLIWDPVTGELAQLISVLRAGRALGAADHLDWSPGRIRAHVDNVNAEGRVCVQIGVLGHPAEPFTGLPLVGLDAIVNWLDSWGVIRRWPSGRPEAYRGSNGRSGRRNRAQWARGGHFGASQVPSCENAGPGAIDIDKITEATGMPGMAVVAGSPGAVAVPGAAGVGVPDVAGSPVRHGLARSRELPAALAEVALAIPA
jgi:hypothetical protein